jgi:hypothetical protein
MKNQKLLIVIFLFVSEFVVAQNARFSQLGSAPIQFNASLTGRFDGKARLGGLYSWQSTNKANMQHQNISFDIKFGRYKSSGDEPRPDPSSAVLNATKPAKEAKDEIQKAKGNKAKSNNANRNKGYWGVGLNYYHYGDDKSPLSASFYSASLARHFYNKRNKFFGFGVQATWAEGKLDERKGLNYDREISGGTFRYPNGTPSNRVSSKSYLDFNVGAYYGMVTESVMFELGGAMNHLFYPEIDILDKDTESQLRHRVTAHSVLRVRFNDKWGLIQKNMYWQEGLYYRSKSFGDSLEIVSFWTGVEMYKTNPKSNINVNFGLYTRSFRTVMPYLNINLGYIANLRYSYEHPFNSKKFNAYSAKRNEVALILTMGRYTSPGTNFYKKANFW